jgi:hypothetical protein
VDTVNGHCIETVKCPVLVVVRVVVAITILETVTAVRLRGVAVRTKIDGTTTMATEDLVMITEANHPFVVLEQEKKEEGVLVRSTVIETAEEIDDHRMMVVDVRHSVNRAIEGRLNTVEVTGMIAAVVVDRSLWASISMHWWIVSFGPVVMCFVSWTIRENNIRPSSNLARQ